MISMLLLITSASLSAAEPAVSHGSIRFHGSITTTPCELSADKLYQMASKNGPRESPTTNIANSKCVSVDDQKSVTYRVNPPIENNTLQAQNPNKKIYQEKTITLSYN